MYALIDIVDTYKVESVDSVDIAIHMRSIIIIELCARQHYLHYITLYNNIIVLSRFHILPQQDRFLHFVKMYL